MADPTDSPADRLDAWLDSDGRTAGDDLTRFAGRVIRDAALPGVSPDGPIPEQRDRMRARVLAPPPAPTNGRIPMTTHVLSANGTAPVTMPPGRRDRPGASALSVLMTAAVVAIIAVATLWVFRDSLDLTPGGDDPKPTDVPALAYSPIASPEAMAACDRDDWFGILPGPAPDLIADTTHLTLVDGTLTLHCGGESEEIATSVREAFTFMIGVIALRTDPDTVRLMNVTTGATATMDPGQLIGEDGTITFAETAYGAEWLAVPENAGRTDWRIIDIRSMESFLLSEELDVPFPRAFEPSFGHITGTDVGVVTWRADNSFLAATPTEGGVSFQSDRRTLVLPGSIEDRRWIYIVDYRIQSAQQTDTSQIFSVSPDGSLLAYTTLTDMHSPVIRVEDAVSGDRLVDVPIDEIDLDTRFILAGADDAYLAVADGETIRILGLAPGATREIAEMPAPGPDLTDLLPTGDPNIVLLVHNFNGTSITPVDVTTGTGPEFYNHAPPVWSQVFGGDELPRYLVRVVSNSLTGEPATIQLVDPATAGVVLESEPVDAHPVQIVSFDAWLRNGGELAVVHIGYNRAVVLDASTGETWQIGSPVDDDRLWSYYPSGDGRFVIASPEPPEGTVPSWEGVHVAPLEPGAEWVPIQGDAAAPGMATPAG